MAFVNLKEKEIQVKIVYYGPGRGGKTSNLEYINRKFANRIKTEMAMVKTQGDRTLFFDFLPFDIGLIKIPFVMQYNKIDLKEQGIPLLPMAILERDLNSKLAKTSFASSAALGTNVIETLKRIISLTVISIKKDLI